MKFTGFFHSAYHSIAIYLETVKYLFLMRLRVYREHIPEMITWLLFAACLAALCFVLGLLAGMIVG